MVKRPLCLAALLFLGIQAVLTGGLHIAEDFQPSGLELAAEEGETLRLRGTVSRREEKQKYRAYYLTDNQVCLDNQIIKESKILVYIKREKSEIQKIGNRIELTGEVRFFQGAANPGNFDQKFYYQKQGIHACVWADEAKIIESKTWRIREGLTVFRCRWKSLLVDCLGKDYGNRMSAILLGDKSDLDPDLKELYQKSGIGHILAISGLHMSFIGMGFYTCLRKAGVPFVPAGSIGMLFLLLYTLMIGCGVSSLRALVMFMVRIGADMTGRTYDPPTSLSLAAAVIVFWQPLYLLDAGFLLSFGAILGIVLVNPVLETFRTVPGYLCGGLSIHLVLFPIMLYYYFEFPVYSILLNLLVVPLMSAVLGAGIAGSLLALLWKRGGVLLLQICRGILWGYSGVCGLSMKLPFSRVITGQPEKIWMAVYYLFLLGGCIAGMRYKKGGSEKNERGSNEKNNKRFYRKTYKKNRETEESVKCRISRGAVFLLLLAFLLISIRCHGTSGELQVTMLDVGQGDGLYIRTPSGRHFLIDGGSTDISEVGKYRMEPFLKSQGVSALDYIFVSHGDADHLNGIQELLENQYLGVPIRRLVLPTETVLDEALTELAQTAADYGTKVMVIEKGEQVTDGVMKLTCLAPARDYEGEIGNASSMVLELEYQSFHMLFTGDLEGTGEENLAESERLADCSVLKVAHHGSKNSTTDAFLEKTMPEIGLISAGRENRYGHPHAETVRRLEQRGCHLYSTQSCGAVTVITDGKKMRLRSMLSTDTEDL